MIEILPAKRAGTAAVIALGLILASAVRPPRTPRHSPLT